MRTSRLPQRGKSARIGADSPPPGEIRHPSFDEHKFFIMGAGVHPKASEGTYLKGYAATKTRKLVSLFSGAMGLDLGLEAAGFDLAGCLEFNHEACET